MKIPHSHNLTIERLHYYNHGPGRYRLPAVRCCEAAGSGGGGHHAHACDRLRLVPACEGQSARGLCGQPGSAAIDSWRPQPWPYDTPLPVGLPRLDSARTLVQIVEREARQHRSSYQPLPEDPVRGRRLDVYI